MFTMRPRYSVVALLMVVYVEPILNRWVGTRCDASVGGSSDLLRILLFPVLEILETSLGLRVVALLAWNGGFWFYLGRALWVRAGGLRYVREWLFMEVISLMLHVAVCSHTDHVPLGTGWTALDSLLSPTAASTNTLFLPRLAWLLVDAQHDGPSVMRWAAGVLGVCIMGISLGQLTTLSWSLTYAVAWAVMCPSRVRVKDPDEPRGSEEVQLATSTDNDPVVFHAGRRTPEDSGSRGAAHVIGASDDDDGPGSQPDD